MNRNQFFGLIMLSLLPTMKVCAQAAASFDEKVTKASDVRLNISNIGTLGNAFRGYRDGTGNQSCEYPAGSGIEHLFEGGLWVGGLLDGSVIAVSTTAVDAPQGYSTGRAGFEFTSEVGAKLDVRSTLYDSPFYSPNAISHEDYVATFSDKNVLIPGTQIPIGSHTNPMKLEVTQETYNWNYSFSNFFVILNYTIVNKGQSRIDSAYIGLWTNTVVRNTKITPAGSGGAAFYNKGGNGYMDSLRMAFCYDAAGDLGFTESYIGQRFLGADDKNGFRHPDVDPTVKTHYNAWIFNNATVSLFNSPQTDNERYDKMRLGLNYSPCWLAADAGNPFCPVSSYQKQLNDAGNRGDLVSVGPFASIAPGDTIRIAFAIVMAKKNEDGKPNSENNLVQRKNLIDNATWAQTAFNGEDVNFNGILDSGEDKDGNGRITRYILPSPPDVPRTKVFTTENKIEIYWSDNAERSIDPISQTVDFEGYKIYLAKFGADVTGTISSSSFVKVGEYDLPGNGYFKETGFTSIKLAEPMKFEGDTFTYRYKYTIEKVLNGWQYAVAVTSFDRGDKLLNLLSLETSITSNDYRVFPGKGANVEFENGKPFVYPNPYYSGAAWEGRVAAFREENRKIIFANLPKKCVIRVFTAAGDLIDEIKHDELYDGSDIRWFKSYGTENTSENVFSGGEHAWDLLSRDTQIIQRGIYLFSVEDIETGKTEKGKFVIIK